MININLLINKKYIFISIFIILVVSLIIGYSYISSDLNLNGTITAKSYTCNQDNLYERISCMSTVDNVASKYISNKQGVDLSQVSSDTNGKGVYTLSSTLGDTYPIHYYRGAVDNNNVKFANFCWKIVRTTATGGTKLIYNGSVDSDGNCSNIPEGSTEITSDKFNTSWTSLADVGYMFKNQYRTVTETYIENTYPYGNSFTYDEATSTYTLIDTTLDTTQLGNHHYTCRNTTGTCDSIYYTYYETASDTAHIYFYIVLSGGKSIEDALNEMHQNDTNSNVKSIIENWYLDNLNSFSTKIEDTIWCNDRSTKSLGIWNPNGTSLNNNAWYYFGSAIFDSSNIKLVCPNQRDNFTISAENGNGLSMYPIGLLTRDEIVLAGGNDTADNTTYYLNNNRTWWTMTPYRFTNNYADLFYIGNTGKITRQNASQSIGIRPSISLNNSQVISSGTGTSNDPYIIN